MKTLRKGTKVKLLNPDETWGEYFTVHKKEKDFVYLVSDNKPVFGICMTVSINKVKLI